MGRERDQEEEEEDSHRKRPRTRAPEDDNEQDYDEEQPDVDKDSGEEQIVPRGEDEVAEWGRGEDGGAERASDRGQQGAKRGSKGAGASQPSAYNVMPGDDGSDDNLEHTTRLLVSNKTVGSVIGKGGSNIKYTRESSGARINIAEGVAGFEDRVVTIIGSRNAVCHAVELIIPVIISAAAGAPVAGMDSIPAIDPDIETEVRINIPSGKAGGIIGKGGETIQQLRELSGCHFQVNKAMQPGELDRLVVFRGNLAAVFKAHRATLIKLSQVEDRRPVGVPVAPRSMGMPPVPPSVAPQQGFRNERGYPRDLPPPYVALPRDDYGRRGYAPVPPSLPARGYGMPPSIPGGAYGEPGGGGPPYRAYEVVGGRGMMPVGRGDPYFPGHRDREREPLYYSRGAPPPPLPPHHADPPAYGRDPYGGYGRGDPMMSGHRGGGAGAPPRGGGGVGGGGSGGGGMDRGGGGERGGDQPVVMHVPNEQVGKIIGRGGTVVNEIRQNSGARIDIEKSDATGNRRVRISGNQDQIHMAHYLITAKLAEDTNMARGPYM